MENKKCNTCGINKKISEYPIDKTLKTGYRGQCKRCGNIACKKYYNQNKTKVLKTRQQYNMLETTKKNNSNYYKNKRKNDINYKIKDNIRRRVNYAIKHSKKSDSSKKLLGCTLDQFKRHIENLWLDGMSWESYGKLGWHLDHIIPCASFDLTDPQQQQKCFHYSNMQPLWAKDNLVKYKKLI